MKVKIEIDTQTFVRFLLVVSGFFGVVFLAWRLWPVLLIIAVSFFLAIALNKPVSRLARHLPRQSRVLATAISYTLFVGVIGFFIAVAVPPIIKQTSIFLDSLPGYIDHINDNDGVLAQLLDKYSLRDELYSFATGIQRQAGNIAQGVGSNVVNGVSSVLTAIFTLISILVLTFLMIIEGPRWLNEIWKLYNNKRLLARHQKLVSRMYRVVTGYVNGQVLVATIAALLASLVLFILTGLFNVPASAVLPLGVVVLLTSLIPMIGATIGAIIIATVLLFNDFGAALVFVGYFLVYQQIENNVIQPAVQSRTVELSALMVFVSVITGIALLGLVGGILAIPVAGCIRVIVLDYIEHRRKEHDRLHKRLVKSKA